MFRYNVKHTLGEGTFGIVYYGQKKSTGEIVSDGCGVRRRDHLVPHTPQLTPPLKPRSVH